jgi:hypothetical protein
MDHLEWIIDPKSELLVEGFGFDALFYHFEELDLVDEVFVAMP